MYVIVNFKDCHCIHSNENLVLPMAGEKRLEIYSSLQWLDQCGPLGFQFFRAVNAGQKNCCHLIADKTVGALCACVCVCVAFHSKFSDVQLCLFPVSFHGAGGLHAAFLIHHLQRAPGMFLSILDAASTRGQIRNQKFPVGSMPEISQSNIICITIRTYNNVDAVLQS